MIPIKRKREKKKKKKIYSVYNFPEHVEYYETFCKLTSLFYLIIDLTLNASRKIFNIQNRNRGKSQEGSQENHVYLSVSHLLKNET